MQMEISLHLRSDLAYNACCIGASAAACLPVLCTAYDRSCAVCRPSVEQLLAVGNCPGCSCQLHCSGAWVVVRRGVKPAAVPAAGPAL